jgi:hypothetical protein
MVQYLRGRGRLLAGRLAVLLAAWCVAAAAAEEPNERVQVVDPYIELRTGAGRGFPVHYVADRGEWIEILLRRTDWFKVRTARGKEGWVHRLQLENTLTEAGGYKTFRDVLLDDYLRRRLEFGVGYGRFEEEPMLKVWFAYNLTDTLSLEATSGQVQGTFSGTNIWHVDLVVQPWSDRRFAPFFGIGVGEFENVPKVTLVGATETDGRLTDAAIGVRFYITDRFVARADYTIYVAFIDEGRTDEYRAVTAGFSFFF